MLKSLTALTLCAFVSTTVFAGNTACDAKAAEKKLAGAAKTSFLKKCGREAGATDAATLCAAKATEKKLAGAAKTSFLKKCEKDATAK